MSIQNIHVQHQEKLIHLTTDVNPLLVAGKVFIVDESGNKIPLQLGQKLLAGQDILIEEGSLTIESSGEQLLTIVSTDQISDSSDSISVEKQIVDSESFLSKLPQSEGENVDKNESEDLLTSDGKPVEHHIVLPFEFKLTGEEAVVES